MRMRIRPLALSLLSGVIVSVSGLSLAAEESSPVLEEILVTAQKREQNLQAIPSPITSFSQANMNLRDATDLRALQNFTPSLEFNNESGGQNNARITLRGIGTETLVGGGDPGVALHIDGVYVGRNSASAQQVFDVDRLEILRGPQGTLYGRNATGGSINIITKNPTDEFEASGDITAGNYNRLRVRGLVNVPISDNVAGRFSILKEDRDGYLENLWPGGKDNDDADVLSLRSKVRWTNTNSEVLLGAYYTKNEGAGAGSRFLGSDTGFAFSPYLIGISDGSVGPPAGAPILAPVYTNPASGDPALPMSENLHEIRKNADEFVDTELFGADLTVKWDLASGLQLKSISSLQFNDNDTLVDADNSELAIEERIRFTDAEQWSQEFNLLSSPQSSVEWLLGAFLYHEELNEDFSTRTPGGLLDLSIPLPGGQQPGGNGVGQNVLAAHEVDSYALFGQATYNVSDRTRVTAGLRYSVDDKTQSRSGVGLVDLVTGVRFRGGGATGPEPDATVSDDWSNLTGKLSIDYDLSDNKLLYAGYSRGFKSGGIPFNGVLVPYEPEVVDAFEIGSKNQFMDNRFRLNLSSFYYDYQDLQVFRLTADGPAAENAAQSTIWGLEAELQAVLTDKLIVDASAGYLNAEYDEYIVEIPVIEDFSGNTLNHAPEHTLNLGGQYETGMGQGDLTIRLDYSRRGDSYFDRANTEFDLQEAYGIFNANVRYEQDNWYLAVYGKNLGDEEYVTGQIINPPFNCGCRTVGVGEPLTFGVTAGISYE